MLNQYHQLVPELTWTASSLSKKFSKRRQRVADLAARSLQDKSSNVRRNAIKLLAKLITTHPFTAGHGGILSLSIWNTGLEVVNANLDALKPAIENPGLAENLAGNETVDADLLDEATILEGEEARSPPTPPPPPQLPEVDNSEEISKLQLTRRYYTDAIRFIETIHQASDAVCQLLSSKNKSEVVEAMDFFKVLFVHKIETSKVSEAIHPSFLVMVY